MLPQKLIIVSLTYYGRNLSNGYNKFNSTPLQNTPKHALSHTKSCDSIVYVHLQTLLTLINT